MFKGFVDILGPETVEGWAYDPLDPSKYLQLNVYFNDKFVGCADASQFRTDLQKEGIGNGCHAFVFPIPRYTNVIKNSVKIFIGHTGKLFFSGTLEPTIKAPHLKDVFQTEIFSFEENTICHDAIKLESLGIHYTEQKFIVMCAPVDWNFRSQRYQHLAMCLADSGFNIFYIGPGSLSDKIDLQYKIHSSPYPHVYCLHVFSPIGEFDHARVIPSESSRRAISVCIENLVNAISPHQVHVALMFPTWFYLFESIRNISIIYDIADYHLGFPHVGKWVYEIENQLIRKAEIVTTTTLSLSYYAIQCGATNTEVVPNAASQFLVEKKSGPPRFGTQYNIKVGYVGALDEWIDVDLLIDIMVHRPDIQFIIAGNGTYSSKLADLKLTNLTCLGEISHDDVAEFIDNIDVGIIPFKRNALTENVDPIKLYEYIGRGKPVLATVFTNPFRFFPFVRFFLSVDDFDTELIILLRENSNNAQRFKDIILENHLWTHRASQFVSIINRLSRKQ